jgi:hypothetical protein
MGSWVPGDGNGLRHVKWDTFPFNVTQPFFPENQRWPQQAATKVGDLLTYFLHSYAWENKTGFVTLNRMCSHLT